MSDNDVKLDDEAKQLKLQLLKEETRNTIAETRNAALIADLNAIKSVITSGDRAHRRARQAGRIGREVPGPGRRGRS